MHRLLSLPSNFSSRFVSIFPLAPHSPFLQSHQALRGHEYIDYRQLGMDYKLLLCEVLFNKALCAKGSGLVCKLLLLLYNNIQEGKRKKREEKERKL